MARRGTSRRYCYSGNVDFATAWNINEFKIRDVLGDGGCLFRALAVLSNGNEHDFQNLIDKIVAHITHDWQAYRQSHLGIGICSSIDESYRTYVQYGNAFGTIAELVAAAHVLQVHIRVLSLYGSPKP